MKVRFLGFYLFFAMFVLFGLTACSQKKEETMNITQNPEITAANIVEKLSAEVKQYPKEPMYTISYGAQYSFFEVWVNDIPVYNEFQYPGGTSGFDINQAILKNGTQKVTYRLYPPEKIEGHPEAYNTLIKETDLELRIKTYDKKGGNPKGTVVQEYKTPVIPNPKEGEYPDSIFIATGKDYYEGSFTFEAEVPYHIQNFDQAQDLRKLDKKTLETKLLKKYEEVKNTYQSKNTDNIARISYDNLKNQFISTYKDKKYIQEVWNMLMEAYQLKSFQMQPIENYEMRFFADGKLVALMSKSKEPWLRGNSVLWGEFDRGDGEETLTMNKYFYILEGENEFRIY